MNKNEWATDFLSNQQGTILIWFVLVSCVCCCIVSNVPTSLTTNKTSGPGRQFYVRGGGPNVETRTMR